MTGATHGGKGDGRRPEANPGAFGGGFDRIDWNARDREAVADMSDEKIDAVGKMEWAAKLLKDNGYSESAKDLLAASEDVGNALVTLERLATHVRPTCTELYDEATAALARVRSS